MATLNEGLTWEQAQAKDKTGTLKDAFLGDDKEGGHAEPVIVKTGTVLYKFTTAANYAGNGLKNSNGEISPWWLPVEPFGESDVGLKGVLKFAKNFGVTPREYMQLIAAINPAWGSKLDVVVQAKLRTDVVGIWGQAASQPKGSAKDKFTGTQIKLVGRIYQLFIPNLGDNDISFVSKDTPEEVQKALGIV